MKKTQLLLTFFSILFLHLAINPLCTAQTFPIIEDIGKTYKIVNEGNYTELDNYVRALNKAELHNFRLRSKSFILNFDNGISFEIFSAEYLQSKGIDTGSLESYPVDFSAERYLSVFQFAANDMILEARVISINKKIAR